MKDDKRFSESSKKKSPSREDLEENEGIKSNRWSETYNMYLVFSMQNKNIHTVLRILLNKMLRGLDFLSFIITINNLM